MSGRVRRNAVAFLDQPPGARDLHVGVAMNCAQCFTRRHSVADFFVDHDAYGVIDCIFFLLAATAKDNASRPYQLTIDCGYKACAWALHMHVMIS